MDAFCLICVLIGVLLFVYVALVGTFPKNSFFAGIFCSFGSALITGKNIIYDKH